MKSVNIAELKNRPIVYLNDVKAGEEILVRDRNQPTVSPSPVNCVNIFSSPKEFF